MSPTLATRPSRRVARRPSPRAVHARGRPHEAALALLVLLLAVVGREGAAESQRAGTWFERPFAVRLVTTGPDGDVEHGALYVGDRAMRLEGSEGEAAYVVLYEFREDDVVMRLLDEVSSTVMTVRFPSDEVEELDVLQMGAITMGPEHPAHPCHTAPEQATCAERGSDVVDGEAARVWAIELRDGFGYVERFDAWISETDGRVLRTAYPDGYRIDFVDYEFGPQPAELFGVPPDYEPR